jgi:hypothetical protein
MSKPVRWTETWPGIMLWDVPRRPRPKWVPCDGAFVGMGAEVALMEVHPLLRDTPAFRKRLGSEVRAEHIKRVKVTVTVEEVTDGDAG